jgi:hypothetical protein
MDPRSEHRLRISIASLLVGTTAVTDCISWNVDVRLDGRVIKQNVAIKNPFTLDEERRCRWYLEQYLTVSPFDIEKSKCATEDLQRYAYSLRAAHAC